MKVNYSNNYRDISHSNAILIDLSLSLGKRTTKTSNNEQNN